MRRLALLFLVPLLGCASFRTQPGQRLVVPPAREQTLTTNRTVVVIIRQEGMSPYCELPDAANEINCTFSYEWFNEGGFLITGADGYRGLDGPSARTACAQAMWSAMGGWEEIDACARALLYYRFVVAPPVEGPQ